MIRSAVVAGLLFLSPGALAQQEEESAPVTEESRQQKAEEPAEQDQETSAEDKEAEVTEPRRGSDRFVPSEEISEDLSVSFPVDI